MWRNYPPRIPPRIGFALMAGGLLLLAACWYLQSLGPIDPYHRGVAQVMHGELAALPPYPGSSAAQTTLSAALLDYYNSLLVVYNANGGCQNIQAYYATLAPAQGWRPAGGIQTLHSSSDPSRAELQSSFRRTTQASQLAW